MKSLIGNNMADIFSLSVPLRTESVFFTVYLAFRCPYWHHYFFLLFV